MGKTPAPSRAGRKSKSKHPERKWCTCQERCDGGREVAASTYRSHNPTTTRASAVRGRFDADPVGGKRKAGYDADGLESEGGFRETRRMRARRIAQNGEMVAPSSMDAAEDRTGTSRRDNGVQPQETKIHEYRQAQIQGYVVGDDGEEEEPSWSPSEVYPMEIDGDYEEDDQIRATLRSVNEMVYAILSWD